MNSISKILRARDNASLKFTVHRSTVLTAHDHSPVPVVFFHPCAANMWGNTIETTIERCGERVEILSLARRGFDENRVLAPGTWKMGWEDATELLQKVTAERKAVLIAWSLGSVIALGLAATQSSRIASIILVEPAYNISSYQGPGLFPMLRGVLSSTILGGIPGLQSWGATSFLRWAFASQKPLATTSTEASDKCHAPDSFDALSSAEQATMVANALAIQGELRNGTGEGDLPPSSLRAISCPVTVLYGSHTVDALRGNAGRVAELLKEAGVQVTLRRVDGCNHLMPLQRVGSETIVDEIHKAVS